MTSYEPASVRTDSNRRRIWRGLVLASIAIGCTKTYRFTVEPGAQLTELVAIDATRRALAAAGYDRMDLTPICFRESCDHSGELLRSERTGPATGDVQWHWKRGAPRRSHFSVRVTKVGDTLECVISNNK